MKYRREVTDRPLGWRRGRAFNVFDYHGWAVVRDDPYETDDGRLHATIERFRRRIGEFNDGSGVTDVRGVNGAFHVWFAGNPNHRHECVFDLFPWLAEHAPGSFGLLYAWDDEDPEFNNAYQVWCLRRGKTERHLDPFLSPCIPQVEDPHDPDREG
jgi:Immunity protein 7